MRPFRHWVAPWKCSPVPLSFIPPPEWSGWEARYDNDLERGKRTTRVDCGYGELSRPDESDRWTDLTGIPGLEFDASEYGGGLQITSPGGYLCCHLDYDHHPVLPARRRALSVVQFHNPAWEPAWGGALVLCDPSGNPVTRIYPEPGRVVAFECGDLSYHGVEEVTGPFERITTVSSYLVPVGRTRALFVPNRRKK